MPAYLAPGVYLRPQRTDRPDVQIVRTDVAGFVGYTERGPLPLPLADDLAKQWRPEELAVRLTSWDEFRAIFGGVLPHAYLAYAVRGFFENGGTTCHVVRVAAVDAKDELERPAFARWAFQAAGAAVAGGTLRETAIAGARDVVAQSPLTLGSAWMVELSDPPNGLHERHLVAESSSANVRLAAPLEATYRAGSLVVAYAAGLVIEARTAGSWGNRIHLDCRPLTPDAAVTRVSLRLRLDPGPDRDHPREEEFYRELSLDRTSPAYAAAVVNPRSRLIRVVYPPFTEHEVVRTGKPVSPTATVPLARAQFADGPRRAEGGRDGLRAVGPDDFGLGGDRLRGLRALEAIDQVSILCAPDAVLELPAPPFLLPPPRPAPCAPPVERPPAPPPDPTGSVRPLSPSARLLVQGGLLEQCERMRDRVAIIDPPEDARATTELLAWRRTVTSRFGATYFPWIRVPDSLGPGGSFRAVPPSGHVAGVYARVDLRDGVHRAPANETLEGVADAVESISTARQEQLNPFGVNVLRAFPGRGVRVWGARSLADEKTDRDWRFIHVRRLISMIEESVEDSMQWTAFEPNDETLRATLVHSLSLFLDAIWQRGGLKGAVPEEGFYVKCDETNNPQTVIDAGQLVCEVGVAIAAPMEFIVFEVRQKPDGADIVEL